MKEIKVGSEVTTEKGTKLVVLAIYEITSDLLAGETVEGDFCLVFKDRIVEVSNPASSEKFLPEEIKKLQEKYQRRLKKLGFNLDNSINVPDSSVKPKRQTKPKKNE